MVAERLDRLGLDYFITGSIASSVYGEMRFTDDVDVVVLLRPKDVEAFCESFADDEFVIDPFSVRRGIETDGSFNILHPSSGQRVDVMLPADSDFNESRFARRQRKALPGGAEGWVASPEHVILKKLEFYQLGGSEKHLRDITSVLMIQGEAVDRAYIEMMSMRMGTHDQWQVIVKKLSDAGQ
jgi:hypothetical protein